MADTQIAFRSSAQVREELRQLARRQGRSMQAMLEDLCRRALANESETPTLAGVIRRLRPHRASSNGSASSSSMSMARSREARRDHGATFDLFADVADEARWNIVRWGHALQRLEEILARRVDFAARRSLPEDVRRRADARRWRCSREAGTRAH